MDKIRGEDLGEAGEALRVQAREVPAVITFAGRPDLVVMTVEQFAVLRAGRKRALRLEEMDSAKLARIAGARMAPEHDHLNALMEDRR